MSSTAAPFSNEFRVSRVIIMDVGIEAFFRFSWIFLVDLVFLFVTEFEISPDHDSIPNDFERTKSASICSISQTAMPLFSRKEGAIETVEQQTVQ